MQLPSDLTKLCATIPLPLQEKFVREWQTWIVTLQEKKLTLSGDPLFLQSVAQVWVGSEIAAQLCLRDPEIICELFVTQDIVQVYSENKFSTLLQNALKNVNDEAMLAAVLRKLRRREILRIIWRDLAGWSDVIETLRDLSNMADAFIMAALEKLSGWYGERYGIPLDSAGNPQELLILALGKLGGRELNLSSDVDLIFVYPEWRDQHVGKHNISFDDFFTRLTQALIKMLDDVTVDGRVFRVDTRLRPFGDSSGQLVMSISALENYYQEHGREWERFALIKARLLNTNLLHGAALLKMLKSFVYRRYVDFSAIAALREMKQLITREIKLKNLQNNIKRGPGGIREIEFIAQVFQLIRGGQDPALQETSLLAILAILQRTKMLPAASVAELQNAYLFFRRTENHLQAYADQQTHDLPLDTPGQTCLCFSLGFANWKSFSDQLSQHIQQVQKHFAATINAPAEKAAATQPIVDFSALWLQQLDNAAALALLANYNFADPAAAFQTLTKLQQSQRYQEMNERSRQWLKQIIPQLLSKIAQAPMPNSTLDRVIGLIESIMRRSAYLALLLENPQISTQLVQLCAASAWIAEQLTTHPVLLDELIDVRLFAAPLDETTRATELQQWMSRVAADDLERQMDTLRQFKHAQVLRIAGQQIMQQLTTLQVSWHLSQIAGLLLQHCWQLAWQQVLLRYKIAPIAAENSGFAVIAYGKLGSLEMSYQSDVDLVFLYDPALNKTLPAELVELFNNEFYARLAQRIIYLLSTRTSQHFLYEVDARLRPSGSAGLLVSHITAFADYQQQNAWVWEHQALVKARFICGDQQLKNTFANIRRDVLCRVRDVKTLTQDIRDMRAQIQNAAKKIPPGLFDIKHSSGGLIDIEFIVQYCVLRYAHTFPEVVNFTDNHHLLNFFMEKNLLPAAEAQALIDSYDFYCNLQQRQALQNNAAYIEEILVQTQQERVADCWKRLIAFSPCN